MISAAINTVFTSSLQKTNSLITSSFTTNATTIIQNIEYTNIINNYNIIKCKGESECDECGGGSDGGSEVSNTQYNFDMWDTFTDVINSINKLLTEFSLGQFDKVAQSLTWDFYDTMSKMLLEIKLDPKRYPEYELIRNTIMRSFQGLYQSVNMYMEIINMKDECMRLKEKENILENMELLKEYITNLSSSSSQVNLFPVQTVTVPAVVVKPEYMEYIKLYGFPQNAIFDMDKLGEIIMRLNVTTNYDSGPDDPENRCDLVEQVVGMESDFSGVPLKLGKVPINVYSTGQEILNYYDISGHMDADISGNSLKCCSDDSHDE